MEKAKRTVWPRGSLQEDLQLLGNKPPLFLKNCICMTLCLNIYGEMLTVLQYGYLMEESATTTQWPEISVEGKPPEIWFRSVTSTSVFMGLVPTSNSKQFSKSLFLHLLAHRIFLFFRSIRGIRKKKSLFLPPLRIIQIPLVYTARHALGNWLNEVLLTCQSQLVKTWEVF